MIDLRDWYWIVGGSGPHMDDQGKLGGDDSRVFSSKRNAYVPSDDPDYLNWISDKEPSFGGNPTTRIDTEENLAAVLKDYNIEARF